MEKAPSLPTVASARPGASPEPPADLRAPSGYGRDPVVLTLGAVAVVSTLGWLFERRRRLPSQPGGIAPAPAAEVVDIPVAPAPPQNRPPASSGLVSRGSKKTLIKLFLVLRKMAGAAAVLSAIAIVVFWAIEFTDVGGREPRLNMTLAAALLAGWSGHWLFGRLANMLHRALFNRDHPLFAD